MASRKLSRDVIGFSGMKAAMRQFFAKDALGLHYAVQIFAGSTIVWLLLRSLGDTNPLWAVVSLIVVAEPRLGTAWLAFLSRTLNTVIGCTMGLCFSFLPVPKAGCIKIKLYVGHSVFNRGTKELALSLPEEATFANVYAILAARLPVLANRVITQDGSSLTRGYACNLNGLNFVRAPTAKVNTGDRIFILSADAGG